MTLPRTVADVLSDHVTFEVECIDRMYLNVWVPRLAYGGGVVGFFVGHRGNRYASTALMDPMSKAFVADIHDFVATRGLELVGFAKGQRKDELTQQFLAGFPAAEGVLYVGRAQEKSGVWRTQRRHNPATGGSYAWLVRATAFINFFYFYCVDADFGPFFIKFSTYFPFTAKICINGNEWAKRQAAKAGIGFEALDNGFAAVDDVDRLQAICDSLGPGHIEALLRKWLKILPNPFTAADEAAGYQYELSVLQAEFSLTQMLDRPVSGRIFFEQVLHENLDIGRPDQIGLVFDRRIIRKGHHPTPGRFRTRVITDGVVPSLHIDYKNSKIKQYHIISSRSFGVLVLQGVGRRRHVLDAPLAGEAGGHSLALTRWSRRSPSSRATCSCRWVFSVRSRALSSSSVSTRRWRDSSEPRCVAGGRGRLAGACPVRSRSISARRSGCR